MSLFGKKTILQRWQVGKAVAHEFRVALRPASSQRLRTILGTHQTHAISVLLEEIRIDATLFQPEELNEAVVVFEDRVLRFRDHARPIGSVVLSAILENTYSDEGFLEAFNLFYVSELVLESKKRIPLRTITAFSNLITLPSRVTTSRSSMPGKSSVNFSL